MSALNKHETEVLREVKGLIDYVLLNGYDAEKGVSQTATGAVPLKGKLKDASRSLNAVTQMKGYYPK